MFGDEVQLARLHLDMMPSAGLTERPWSFLKSLMRRSAYPTAKSPTDVLFAPVPPATGALWRMCTNVPSFVERTHDYADCGGAPSDACSPSPAASLVGTSALCPCCEWEKPLHVAQKVCNCNALFPRWWERRVLKRGGTSHQANHQAGHQAGHQGASHRAGARNESRRAAARGHAPVLPEGHEGHAAWGERLLLDQLVIGTPRAMDVFAGLAAALPATFARNGARGQRTLSEFGFVTENLLGTHVARAKQWLAVRPVTWLQWGIKADTGHQRDWDDAGTHRGGREAWQPPELVAARPRLREKGHRARHRERRRKEAELMPWVRSSGGTGEVRHPARLNIRAEGAPISLGGKGLRWAASDTSEEAQRWRRQPFVQRALQIVSDLPFRYPNRRIRYNLSDAAGTISMRDLAWAYELAHGEVGVAPRVLDSGGSQQAQHAGVSLC